MLPRHLPGFLATAAVSLSLVVGLGASAFAEGGKTDPVRVRGTIISFADKALTVKTREGDTANVTLAPNWKLSGVASADVASIKPGDFVGIASLPTESGGDGALEVVIFPPAMKGTGEGSRPWDLKPNSTMTNATVADAVTGVDGRTVTVSYRGGEKKIAIPEGTPVVTFAPATEADLKPGTAVFIIAEKALDGRITADRIVVGTNGVVPPM
ncbi:hypothetical protein [Pleomorphomonas oryzae]|uniref:hypothetical protein n=1 Tax=Pleomorphomonas oryzae TaxID=261934 RepID=UPI0003FECA19|nr:hypothetical protein [Pleomorphomonas oryzae]